MTDRISDRLLERARLGELTDEESAELIERLEATEGTTERLDALIEADAEFLDRFPAQLMAPRIRERLRRARRAEDTPLETGGLMLSARRIVANHWLALAAGVAGLLLVFGALRWTTDNGGRSAPDRAVAPAAGVKPSPPANPTPSGPLDSEGRGERPMAPDLDVLSEIFDPQPSEAGELVLAVGETATIEARGVSRVIIDEESVASVKPVEEHLLVRAGAVGTTPLRVVRKDGTYTAFVRVAKKYPGSPILSGGAMVRCLEGVETASDAVLSIRLLIAPAGSVMTAYAERSSYPERVADCLVREARRMEFPKGSDIVTTTMVFYGKDAELRELSYDEVGRMELLPQGWEEMSEEEKRDVVDEMEREAMVELLKGRYESALAICGPIVGHSPQCARTAAIAAQRLDREDEACQYARISENDRLRAKVCPGAANEGPQEPTSTGDDAEPDPIDLW